MPGTPVFYWRRFARIWPLHILATIITARTWWLIDHPIGASLNVETLWPAVFLIHAWSPETRVIQGGSGASWSLSDEAFFYTIFPLILPIMMRFRSIGRLLFIPVAATIAYAILFVVIPLDGLGPWYRAHLLDYFPLTRSLQFVSGVAIAIAIKRGYQLPMPIWQAIGIVVLWHAVLIPWSNATERGTLWYPYSASQLFSLIPFAILIEAAATADIDGRSTMFRGHFRELLGHASFALYLFHGPCIVLYIYLFGEPLTINQRLIACSACFLLARQFRSACSRRSNNPWSAGYANWSVPERKPQPDYDKRPNRRSIRPENCVPMCPSSPRGMRGKMPDEVAGLALWLWYRRPRGRRALHAKCYVIVESLPLIFQKFRDARRRHVGRWAEAWNGRGFGPAENVRLDTSIIGTIDD